MNLMGLAIVPLDQSGQWKYYAFAVHLQPIDILGNTRFIDGNGDGIVAWDIGAYELTASKLPKIYRHPSTHYKRLDVECHRTHEQMG